MQMRSEPNERQFRRATIRRGWQPRSPGKSTEERRPDEFAHPTATAGGGFADFSEEQSVHFTVVGDGHPHTYAVKLAGQPGWNGTIGRLRLDPAAVGGISVDIDSISSKPTST